jgi:hypothetical protein
MPPFLPAQSGHVTRSARLSRPGRRRNSGAHQGARRASAWEGVVCAEARSLLGGVDYGNLIPPLPGRVQRPARSAQRVGLSERVEVLLDYVPDGVHRACTASVAFAATRKTLCLPTAHHVSLLLLPLHLGCRASPTLS